MRKFFVLIFFLLSFAVYTQAQVTTQNARRTPTGSGAPGSGGSAPPVACVLGPPFGADYTDISTTPPTIYKCKSGSLTATAGGTTSAPKDATYITQTPNTSLSNEQALSLLATGIPLITTTTGVISISNVTNDVQTKASIVPNTAPSAGQVLCGNAGGTAYAPCTIGGDATLANTGVLSLTNTAVTPAAYTNANITVDSKGRITAAASGSSGITNSASNGQVAISNGTNIVGDSDLTFLTDTLTVTKLVVSTSSSLGVASGTSLAIPIIGPSADSTTAIKFTKADLSTVVGNVDTSSSPSVLFWTALRTGALNTANFFDISRDGATGFLKVQGSQAGFNNIWLAPTSGAVQVGTGTNGGLIFATDNAVDIGASGATRPRSIYVASNGTFGGTLSVTGASTLPTINGGTGTTQTLTYKTTTGVGATGADHIFQVGNNGATEAMRITNAGLIGIGTTGPSVRFGQKLDISVSANYAGLSLNSWSASQHFPLLDLAASGSSTVGTHALVTNGQGLGRLTFRGSDGAVFQDAASIESFVDAAPGTNDMPGRLSFKTTADGSTTLTEQMRITNSGTIFMYNLGSDGGATDATICRDTTSKQILVGSGTLGICLGTSSERFKNNLRLIGGGALDRIMALTPKSYFYNPDHGDGGRRIQYGLTAEQAGQVFPELVGYDTNGKPNTFDMFGTYPWALQAIKEMQNEILSLRAEMGELKAKKP